MSSPVPLLPSPTATADADAELTEQLRPRPLAPGCDWDDWDEQSEIEEDEGAADKTRAISIGDGLEADEGFATECWDDDDDE